MQPLNVLFSKPSSSHRQTLIYNLRRTAKIMFSSLLVCLFVCLLATLREDAWIDFHEIFGIYRERYKVQSEFFVCLFRILTPCMQGFFLYFFKEIGLTHYRIKQVNGFLSIFMKCRA